MIRRLRNRYHDIQLPIDLIKEIILMDYSPTLTGYQINKLLDYMLSGLIRWEVMPRWMIRKMVINPGPRIEESKLAILSSATELVRNLQLVLEEEHKNIKL